MQVIFSSENSIHLKRRDVFIFKPFVTSLVNFQICSFIVTYKTLLGDAEIKKIEAKKCVSYEEDYLKFEEACAAYSKLDGYIQEHLVDVQRIKLKSNGKKLIAFLAWLVTTILSAVLANNNQSIIGWIKSMFMVVG